MVCGCMPATTKHLCSNRQLVFLGLVEDARLVKSLSTIRSSQLLSMSFRMCRFVHLQLVPNQYLVLLFCPVAMYWTQPFEGLGFWLMAVQLGSYQSPSALFFKYATVYGIGRRVGFRFRCFERVGSSPIGGTKVSVPLATFYVVENRLLL